MRRCRVTYLHLPTSARLTFTVPVSADDAVLASYQGRSVADKFLSTVLYQFVYLSSVDMGDLWQSRSSSP